MELKEVREILLSKGFTETVSNDHGTYFVNSGFSIAFLFTDTYDEDKIEEYRDLRDLTKKMDSIGSIGYLDKSTFLVFNKTIQDLDVVLNDDYDFIKSGISIIKFIPDARKEVELSEMGNINDTGDMFINPYVRFYPSSFLVSFFKQLSRSKKPFKLKYPPIMHGMMELSWLKYWVKKISL